MSPRSTKCFHQLSHSQHLLAVARVGFKSGDFGGEFFTPRQVSDLAEQGRADGFRLTEPRRFEGSQGFVCFIIQADGYRSSHDSNVSQIVVRPCAGDGTRTTAHLNVETGSKRNRIGIRRLSTSPVRDLSVILSA